LRSTDCRQTAFNFFKRNKYDIVFLQETHWTKNLQTTIQHNWDGDIYFSNGTENARGVAILIHASLDYILQRSKRDSHGRILSVEISTDETAINLVNIYASRSDSEGDNSFKHSTPIYQRTMTTFLEEISIQFQTHDSTNSAESQKPNITQTKH